MRLSIDTLLSYNDARGGGGGEGLRIRGLTKSDVPPDKSCCPNRREPNISGSTADKHRRRKRRRTNEMDGKRDKVNQVRADDDADPSLTAGAVPVSQIRVTIIQEKFTSYFVLCIRRIQVRYRAAA